MSKYTPLTAFLAAQDAQEVAMTFAEIERVLGAPLPRSKQHPAWWSNNASNNVMTRAWLEAGFRSERVDVGGERLVFRRDGAAPDASAEPEWGPGTVGFFDRVRAVLGGTVTIMPGVDITEPIDVEWDAMQ